MNAKPENTNPGRLRLLTIPISHYCEKVRWALDRLALPYIEERHLQVFHYARSYQLSHGPNVPVLIDGKTCMTDSTAILQYLERYTNDETQLYPLKHRAEIEALEELFDETLGIESRRWVYFHAMQTPSMALRISSQGVPKWQAGIAPLFYPLLKAFIRRKLVVSTGTVELGLERARNVVGQVDSLLSDGRAYLLGNRFTAADLTFASMMAPFLMPPEYGVRLPKLDEIGVAMRSTVEEMRSTRAGQHALFMYQTQRRPALTRVSEINAQVTPQSSFDQSASVN
jgi:glutathione S-transferase